MMNSLVSMNVWVLVALITALTLLVSGAMVFVFARLLGGEEREKAGTTAAAYMTALGSLFAILTGFLINS